MVTESVKSILIGLFHLFASKYSCLFFVQRELNDIDLFTLWYSIPFRLFDEWKGLDVSHSLTVVFFSRTFITPNNQNQGLNILEHDFETAQKDSEGRLYEVSMELLPKIFCYFESTQT